MSFPGASVGLNTLLLSASARQLVWSETFLGVQLPFLRETLSAFIVYSSREGSIGSGQFQGLSEAFLNYFPA